MALFNGTSSRAETAGLGGVSASPSAATTMAAIIRIASLSAWHNIIAICLANSGNLLDLTISNADVLCVEGEGSTISGPDLTSRGTGWYYVSWGATSAHATPGRFYYMKYGSDAALLNVAGDTGTNQGTNRQKIELGAYNGNADWFDGDILQAAIWNADLSAAAHDFLAHNMLWQALNPAWLVRPNHRTIPTSIEDLSGGGNPLTTLTNLAATAVSHPIIRGGGRTHRVLKQPSAGGGETTDPATQGVATGAGTTPVGVVTAAPTQGVAPGAGTTPVAAVSQASTQGVAPGAGTTPAAAISATPTQGVAPGAGVAPTPQAVQTPTQGVAVGAGFSPGAVASPAQGVAIGAGFTPGVTAVTEPTQAVAPAVSFTPSPDAKGQPSSGIATGLGTTPTPDIDATPTQGVAVGAGTTPSDGQGDDVTQGVAIGAGTTPTPVINMAPTRGIATGSGTTPTVTVAVSPVLAVAIAQSNGASATITVTPTRGIATGIGNSPNDGQGEDAYPTTGETHLVIYQAPATGLTINQVTAELTVNPGVAAELTINNPDGELTINAS